MPLNPKYVLGPSLEMLFIDKDTLAPLAGGKVKFFVDSGARNVGKNVYTITGTPPNYTYVSIGDEVILNGDGSFSDNLGNNILPYYYPFAGDPSANSDQVELYYITVENASGVTQFTREGWPNYTAATEQADLQIKNYIPNGQFLLHNDNPPPTHTVNYGSVDSTLTVTDIAQGGWTVEVGVGEPTPGYTITFPEYTSYESTIAASPKFACNIATTVGSALVILDLRCKWPDVNKFASDTQEYTFLFTGYSSGSNVNCEIRYIKYFGTGGSTTIDTAFTGSPIVLTSTITQFALTQFFSGNEGYTIGDGNYFQVAIRLPSNQVCNVTITDCMLVPGTVEAAKQPFPTTPDADFIAQSVAGWLPTPNPDGSDLYLPMVLTPTGATFDHSQIGNITQKLDLSQFSGSISTVGNELMCDGSQYLTTGYSDLGIPYARLQSVLFENQSDILAPIYGTGPNFVQAYWRQLTTNPSTPLLYIATGSPGNVTDSNAGTTPFTVTKVADGSTHPFKGFVSSNDNLLIIGNAPLNADTGVIQAGTSGFTVQNVRNSESSILIAQVVCTDASALAPSGAGSYFYFYLGASEFFVWYNVNGNNTLPVVSGTGIEVNVSSNDSANYVTALTAKVMFGSKVTGIQCVAASSITPSQYWEFYDATNTLWKVWYSIDGVGTAPSGNAIKVSLTSADNAHTVTQSTISTINSIYFAVPDFRGFFLRGYDPTGIRDSETYARYTALAYAFVNNINTFEIDESFQHRHGISYATSGGGAYPQNLSGTPAVTGNTEYYPSYVNPPTTNTYGLETRPINAYVLYAIKY